MYQVELDKSLKTSDMDKIIEGVNLEDGFIKVDDIAYTTDDKSVLGVSCIPEKKPDRACRLFEHLGYSVKKLDRVILQASLKGFAKRSLEISEWDGDYKSENDYGNKKFAGKGSSEIDFTVPGA